MKTKLIFSAIVLFLMLFIGYMFGVDLITRSPDAGTVWLCAIFSASGAFASVTEDK